MSQYELMIIKEFIETFWSLFVAKVGEEEAEKIFQKLEEAAQ